MFVPVYLLLHGVVKVAIVVALLIVSKRVYPWPMAGLGAFVVFQIYELIMKSSVGIVALTVLDVVIIWLTWREWRRGGSYAAPGAEPWPGSSEAHRSQLAKPYRY